MFGAITGANVFKLTHRRNSKVGIDHNIKKRTLFTNLITSYYIHILLDSDPHIYKTRTTVHECSCVDPMVGKSPTTSKKALSVVVCINDPTLMDYLIDPRTSVVPSGN